MARAYIGLGANLGAPLAALRGATQAIGTIEGVRLIRCSSIWRSAPVDAAGPHFLNAVVAVDTSLDAQALLAALQAIEHQAGRERPYRHAPRTLDLDLLWFDDLQIESAGLTLPHPRMHLRRFVLAPLHEIAPALALPRLGPIEAWLVASATQACARMADRLPGP